MPNKRYAVLATKSFVRIYKKATKKYPDLPEFYEQALNILEKDPINTSTRYKIKKLINVPDGEGAWRIRIGVYRLRYDVAGNDVVLHIIGHRKDIYQKP